MSDPATALTNSTVAVATSAPNCKLEPVATAPLALAEALEATLAKLDETAADLDEALVTAEVALAAREEAELAPEVAEARTEDAPLPMREVRLENPPPPPEVSEENPLPPRELAWLMSDETDRRGEETEREGSRVSGVREGQVRSVGSGKREETYSEPEYQRRGWRGGGPGRRWLAW